MDDMMALNLDGFMQKNMKQKGHFVAARLQTALALLEKLRDNPSLNLDDHLASKGSSGLVSHETFGDLAHKRLNLKLINKNHGRRSSSLQDWGQQLLDVLGAAEFNKISDARRGSGFIPQRIVSTFAYPRNAIKSDILWRAPVCEDLRIRRCDICRYCAQSAIHC